jgi:hypothetical protein
MRLFTHTKLRAMLILSFLLLSLLMQGASCDIFGELTGGQTAKDIKQEEIGRASCRERV